MDAEVGEIALQDWLDFLEVLEANEDLVGVMMRPGGDHLTVEPVRHRDDLLAFMGDD